MASAKSRPAGQVDGFGVVLALPYHRVSLDEQEREGLSLPAQRAACRRYIADHADRGWIIGDEFQDVMTGRRDDRPAYQGLLADVRRLRGDGRRVVIVLAALDRFGRRVLERVRSREELKSLGVAIHSVREGGEVTDLVWNILASVAEEESRTKGLRVSETWRHTTAQGWHKVGSARWGYRWRPATSDERAAGAPRSVLEAHPDEAPWLGEAYAKAAAGGTVRAVARWAAGLPESARGGRRLAYPVVREALTSPLYIARIAGAVDVAADPGAALAAPRGRWPALVDDATWQRAQEHIARHKRLPRQATGRFLLTGMIRCPRCGARMTGGADRAHGERYYCAGLVAGGAGAPDTNCTATVTATHINGRVLAMAKQFVTALASTDPAFRADVRREWERLRRPTGTAATEQQRRQFEAQAARLRQRVVRATERFADDEISKAAYDDMCAKAHRELAETEAALGQLRTERPEPALPPLHEALRPVGDWAAALDGMDVPAQREVLAELIERVVPIRLRPGRYRPLVTWTPTWAPLQETLTALAGDLAAGTGEAHPAAA